MKFYRANIYAVDQELLSIKKRRISRVIDKLDEVTCEFGEESKTKHGFHVEAQIAKTTRKISWDAVMQLLSQSDMFASYGLRRITEYARAFGTYNSDGDVIFR